MQDYYTEAGGKEPRYYQRVAINRVVEAVAKGEKRLLLVMATGTGKTYTAFQTIWRLWKAGRAKRVLFLADRNILVDQAIQNDFRPFGGAMVKVQQEVDKSFEVYLALYQAITGPEGREDLFRQFSPDFFDLVVVDECHRGSASENSAWREVLDYFEPAAQLGLTATPKETTDVSTSHYFGDAVYTYSLKQGIDDGFLAPYRVIRVGIDRDLEGWRPEQGQRDKYGREVEDRVYGQKDFDRTIVIEDRTTAVAERIAEYLEGTDPYAKTIVFCVDIDHASRMRRAILNAQAERAKENRLYAVQITGDNDEGKRALDDFIDPESRYPVVATTSKLLTTGVDAQTCKLIVLDQHIGSMTEFKQIIGRGTRLREDYGKRSFTIMDFRQNTDKFADPDFDGEPVRVYVAGPGDDVVPPETEDDPEDEPDETPSGKVGEPGGLTWDPDDAGRPQRPVVEGTGARVINERVQYMGPDGKLITESLRDYTRARVQEQYQSLDDFLTRWRAADRKAALVDELADRGVFFAELQDLVSEESGAAGAWDPFDLVAHVAFDRPPLTRERAGAPRPRRRLLRPVPRRRPRRALRPLGQVCRRGDRGRRERRGPEPGPVQPDGPPAGTGPAVRRRRAGSSPPSTTSKPNSTKPPDLVMRVTVVRAHYGQHTDAFRENGYVGIGWFDPPIPERRDRASVRSMYEAQFPNDTKSQVDQGTGQVYRFLNDIQPGGLVVTPYAGGGLLVGRVTGEPYGADDETTPYGYRIPVEWRPEPVDRSELSIPLQNTLKSSLTVFNVKQVADFCEAAGIEHDGAVLGLAPPTVRAVQERADLYDAVKAVLLELDDKEFERLVSYVLQTLGFEATQETGRSGDGGIDFEGELRVMGVASIRLQVQVKRYADRVHPRDPDP